ncbi:MAG: sugar phosphate nucleotidyltransferase [candidate division WOR-3 bacterium]
MKSFALILAGGQGERFWPLSQPDFPKQFISIFNNQPLINQTLDRIKDQFTKERRFLIIPQELEKITRRFVGNENLIIEPDRKNTAPAICLGAMILKQKYGDGIIHVLPADHIINDRKKFLRYLHAGAKMAEEGFMVTYGIIPERPETGYGYIKIGRIINECNGIVSFYGERFTEKPSLNKAIQYLKTKKYLWNSGIFTFRIINLLDEMKTLLPEVYQGVEDYLKFKNKRFFAAIPAISIDYGLMEKTRRICVIKSDFGWDDVGTYLALERYFKKDKNDNIAIADVVALDTQDSIIYSDNVPVRVWGVKGLVIVASPRGVLVCKKTRVPELKKLIAGENKRRSK